MAAVLPLVPVTRQADGSAASAAPQAGHGAYRTAFRDAQQANDGGAPTRVQRAALQVSSPHDAAEREASDVARRVVQMPSPAVHRVTGTATTVSPVAHRIVARSQVGRENAGPGAGTGGQLEPATAARIQASRGGGQGLSVPLRRFMEPRFGADFSKVRIHTDANAQQLSRRLSARAFTVGGDIFFGAGQYQPDTAQGRELIAHELTHTLQQGAATAATATTAAPQAIHRASLAESVTPQPSGLVQRLGLSDILDGLADLAANVPGYTLLTLVIGRNPINMRTVERNTVNLLRAFIGLIPGGELLFQVLQRQGIALRIATWVDAQTTALGLNFQTVRDAFTRFTESLSWTDIFSPGDVWRRAQAIFTPLIARVTGFVGGLITQAITWLKETFMAPLSDFCRQIPGYGLVTVLLGRDPFTNAPVPRTAMTVVRAFAEFIPGGTEKVDQLVQSGALDRAYAWFQQETSARNLTWERVTGTFSSAWASLQLSDVMHPIDTITRIVGLFRPLMSDLVGFAGAALMKLLELIYEAAMGAGGRRILAILMRARATFVTIIRNPVGFLRNLMGAIGQGIRQFMGNILTHLRDGVIRWLTGPVAAAGVQMPERWDVRGIIWFVLQILGLTWDRVRGKLVRLIGEPAMAALERGFQLIQDIRERGLVQALRDRVTEFFGNLRESALGAIRSFIQQRLVQAGIQQLLSLLSPVGAIVQAIIKTYTTIQFFIQKINQILDLVESIVNSIAAIASGALGAAANLVERTMARTIPVILDFLARFIGLGDVGAQVQTTIRNLQGAVDRMLDRAVEWIRTQATRLGSAVAGGARSLAARVGGWWRAPRPLTTRSGEQHTLLALGDPPNARLVVRSTERSLDQALQDIEASKRQAGQPIPAEIADARGRVARFQVVNRNASESETQRPRIEADLTFIQGVLARHLPPDNVPLTAVTFEMNQGRPRKVMARPLTRRAGNTTGTSQTSSIDTRFPAGIDRMQWKALHLLNHELHGPNAAWNLIPGSGSANGLMSPFENAAKPTVTGSANGMLWYSAEVLEYWDASQVPWHAHFAKRLLIKRGPYDPANPSAQPVTQQLPVTSQQPPQTIGAAMPINFSTSGHVEIGRAVDPTDPAGRRLAETLTQGVGQRIVNARTRLRAAEGKSEWDSAAHLASYLAGELAQAKIQHLIALTQSHPALFQVK